MTLDAECTWNVVGCRWKVNILYNKSPEEKGEGFWPFVDVNLFYNLRNLSSFITERFENNLFCYI